MSNLYKFEWHTHLCEYYGVNPEDALRLGTRKTGRRPNLPGSETCQPVEGKNLEEIWEIKERTDLKDIFDFYKDQGAWSSFRQCVRHKDLEQYHLNMLGVLRQLKVLKEGTHICEYGCGVAPYVTSLLKYLDPSTEVKLKLTMADVDCDHFNFAKFRLNDIKEKRGFTNVDMSFETITPEKLPNFDNVNLDVVICFEVLEHTPSPVDVINNIKDNMAPGGVYIENFIKHPPPPEDDTGGPDLESARLERTAYYEILEEYFNLVSSRGIADPHKHPNETRVWQRNSL
tara:strand:- start:538 stop:1395 length:858 start_codon:yes stop_codon:yes gene_type:complete